VALSFASRGFGSPSSRLHRPLERGLGQLICSLHDALAQVLGLISKYLSLPTDELALKLRQFLRFLHAKELVSEVEGVREIPRGTWSGRE
jgi:hypothetical protein